MSRSSIGRSFNEIVEARVGREPAFASALLEEAVECLLTGELTVARSLIRDVIKGSIGYAELSRRTGTPEKSLIRMFGPSGNPTAANISCVLHELQRYGCVRLRVRCEPAARTRAARKRLVGAKRSA